MKNYMKTSIGLLGFLAFPFLLQFLRLDLKLFEGSMWLLLSLIILWIYFVEKRTITSIGWKKLTAKTVLLGIGLGFVVFILFGVLTAAIRVMGLELNQETAALIASQPFPFLLLIALRAAVVEEVLYRGFAFERIYDLTKSKWLAGLIPVLIFTLVHYSWGIGHLVFVFFAGGIFMLVYISKRNLGLIMIAHFITDVIALLVLPLLLNS